VNDIVVSPSALRHENLTVSPSIRPSNISTAPVRGQFVTAPVSVAPSARSASVHPIAQSGPPSDFHEPVTWGWVDVTGSPPARTPQNQTAVDRNNTVQVLVEITMVSPFVFSDDVLDEQEHCSCSDK
jgi:hypothetical protein